MVGSHEHILAAEDIYVPGKVNVVDLSGYTIGSFVIFQSQRDFVRVITLEQALIQANLAARPAVQNVLGELVEGLEDVHLHGLANGVLAFDVRQGPTTHGKVLRDHAKVIVPAFVVSDNLTLQVLECERRDIISQLVLRKYLGWHLRCILLVLNIPDYHALQNGIRLARMRMGFRQVAISQRVISIVKLGYIPSKVLLDCELATRVDSLIACRPQH